MSTTAPRCRERGSAIITAIFILVVLGALGGFMAVFSTTQHLGAALDVLGTQAHFAARSGAEIGAYQAMKGAAPDCSTALNTSTLPAQTIGGFTVVVEIRCMAINTAEAGLDGLYGVYVTACQPAGGTCPGDLSNPAYVERSLFVLVEK